jgi:hypothetical protein
MSKTVMLRLIPGDPIYQQHGLTGTVGAEFLTTRGLVA